MVLKHLQMHAIDYSMAACATANSGSTCPKLHDVRLVVQPQRFRLKTSANSVWLRSYPEKLMKTSLYLKPSHAKNAQLTRASNHSPPISSSKKTPELSPSATATTNKAEQSLTIAVKHKCLHVIHVRIAALSSLTALGGDSLSFPRRSSNSN